MLFQQAQFLNVCYKVLVATGITSIILFLVNSKISSCIHLLGFRKDITQGYIWTLSAHINAHTYTYACIHTCTDVHAHA